MRNEIKDFAIKILIIVAVIATYFFVQSYFEQKNHQNLSKKPHVNWTLEDKLRFKQGL